MGESGAGKTTLMDVLAGRKTVGSIAGDIRINGYPKDDESFNRVAGYGWGEDVCWGVTACGNVGMWTCALCGDCVVLVVLYVLYVFVVIQAQAYHV